METSLWIFSVRNMWTPRPNSEKWSSHSRSFTCSMLWHEHANRQKKPAQTHVLHAIILPNVFLVGFLLAQLILWPHSCVIWIENTTHLVAIGPRLVLVEGRHQSLAVDGVAQNLLLYLLFIRIPSVVVEGVVGCRWTLGKQWEENIIGTLNMTPSLPVSSHCAYEAFSRNTYQLSLAVSPAAEHGVLPLQSSESGVQILHQLVSVVQLDQLECLLRPNTHYDGVGKQGGAFCFFYGQHLMREWRRKGFNPTMLSMNEYNTKRKWNHEFMVLRRSSC